MDRGHLITSIPVGERELAIRTDFRDILHIFEILNDPDLLEVERYIVALEYFFVTEEYLEEDFNDCVDAFCTFINGGDSGNGEVKPKNDKPLYDWNQDFNIIIPPVNRSLGYDVREKDYVHWWTFLGAFMEIGECTFSTFVAIRNKLNKGIKLDKAEEKVYKENVDRIQLKHKYDATTQSIMDEILGKGV